jgi:hypothetical protein
MKTMCSRLLWHRHLRRNTGHQGTFSEAGTHENHLALSLGCRGDDQFVSSQMSWVLAAVCGQASLAPSVSTTSEIPGDRGEVTVKCVGNAGKVTKLWIVCSHEHSLRPHARNHRWPQMVGHLLPVMHIFMSFKVSSPSPYHRITRGIFSIHLTKLMMNVCWLHSSCIQETDNRPHFTGAGPLDCVEHVKHTEQCVTMSWLSQNCVCGLPMDKGTQHA